MEDNELELDLDTAAEDINRKNNRIKSLSDKYKTAAEERDAKAKALEEEQAKVAALQKDADFFKNFNTVASKYQGASEFQDKIREKAALGLDIEEATMLVMAKEGKLSTPTAPTPNLDNVAGGSASTAITGQVDKAPRDMSQDERRSALAELESKGELQL